MSEQWWIIKDNASGQLRQVVTDGRHPKDAGEDTTNRRAYKMARRGDLLTETPNLTSGAWTDNLAVIKQSLLDAIDDQRETAQMRFLTGGGAKKMIYSQKAKEVIDFRSLGSTAVATLNLETRRQRFPAAMAEVDLTGASLASVIGKFEVAATNANTKIFKLEALAQRGKEGIKAATTAAAARAAANVNWVVA